MAREGFSKPRSVKRSIVAVLILNALAASSRVSASFVCGFASDAFVGMVFGGINRFCFGLTEKRGRMARSLRRCNGVVEALGVIPGTLRGALTVICFMP